MMETYKSSFKVNVTNYFLNRINYLNFLTKQSDSILWLLTLGSQLCNVDNQGPLQENHNSCLIATQKLSSE